MEWQGPVLEPVSTGDIIDRAVRLYRRNFAPLVLIVTIPSLVAYVGSLMAMLGYFSAITGTSTGEGIVGVAVAIIGYFLIYIVWPFLYLLTIGGLVRSIADHFMLGARIRLRSTISFIRQRLSDLLLAGLLLMVMAGGVLSAVYVVVLFLALAFAFILGALGATAPWLVGALAIILGIAVIFGILALLLSALARVIFIPQIIMIEGLPATAAISRSMKLGARNWWRVGAIVLFNYFIAMAIAAALGIPILVYAIFNGSLQSANEFTVFSWGTIIYSTITQLSSILATPIMTVAFTLLYFDNRVRKEAYDIELLARRVAPQVQAQFPPQPLPPQPQFAFANQPVAQSFSQQSPLGLSGAYWGPTPPRPDVAQATVNRCPKCARGLIPEARFCMYCGFPTSPRLP